MSKNSVAHIFFLLSFIGVSCNREDAPDCFKTAGKDAVITRELSSFNRLEVRDLLFIELIQAPYYKAEISGPENMLPKITSDVTSGTLYLENSNTCNFVRSFRKKVSVKVFAPYIRDIQNRGTGEITSRDTLFFPYLKIENRHAAGKVDLIIHGDSVSAYTQTGVADIRLSGKVYKAELFNQGYGKIEARELEAEQTYINHSGINSVDAYCSGYLFAINYFSGTIRIAGHPTWTDIFREGSGPIIIE